MEIKEYTINTLSEYLDAILKEKDQHKKLWFRGHNSKDYQLLPTVYRKPYTWKDETVFLHQFKARSIRFLDKIPVNNIEWLFVMQHYKTPTRLLDWTESAIVALSFAIQFNMVADSGATIWCLDPVKLNEKTRFSQFEYEPIPNICEYTDLCQMFESQRIDYPLAIMGPQNTDRIIAQKGVFTLFPNKEVFSMESLQYADEFLVKININKKVVEDIKKDLYYIGISETVLFPELESVSKEIIRDYSLKGVKNV